jgi:hypothetical protein
VNVLDENVRVEQRGLLRRWGIRVRQIGYDIGWEGMQDDEIISLLHRLDRPTFFTRDEDFYNRRLCHEGYCLVYLDIGETRVAEYVRRVLRHPALNSKAKRMGRVIRASPAGMTAWRIHREHEESLSWPSRRK